MIENLLSRAADTKEKAVTAIRQLDIGQLRQVFDRSNTSTDDSVAEINLDRVTKGFSATPPSAYRQVSNLKIDSWKNKDMEQLEASWGLAQETGFTADAVKQFQNDLHNLQGASTLYGGETLMRLTESLQKLLLVTDADPAYQTLIGLHIQACRAAIFNETPDAAETSQAVCRALESQVMRIIQRGF